MIGIPGKPERVWEPTVYELEDGTVEMLARNLDRELNGGHKCEPSTMMMVSSQSTDYGESWSEFNYVPIETVSARTHVVKSDNRYIMTNSDYRRCEPYVPTSKNEDRRNLALFFSKDGLNWVAGNRYSDEETFVTYPQMFVKGNNLYILYSYNNLDIRSVVIKQLPKSDKNYIFPRQNTDPIILEYSIEPEKSSFAFPQDLENLSGIFNIRLYEIQGSMAIIDSRGSGSEFYFILKQSSDKKSMRPCIRTGAIEQCAENLNIEKNVYARVGFGVSDNSKIYLFVDDKIEYMNPDYLRLSDNQFTIGGKNIEASSLQNFIGEIEIGRFYAELLSEEQIHSLNQGYFIQSQEYGDLISYETPVLDPVISRIEHDSENLVFYGEGSAGIEVEPGDTEISFSFLVPDSTEEKITLFTAGDGNNPLRLVYNNEELSAEYLRASYPISEEYAKDVWHSISLKFGDEIIINADAGSVSISQQLQLLSPYFGEGYPQHAITPESSFIINITSVKVLWYNDIEGCNNDGVCDPEESCSSCPQDYGVCSSDSSNWNGDGEIIPKSSSTTNETKELINGPNEQILLSPGENLEDGENLVIKIIIFICVGIIIIGSVIVYLLVNRRKELGDS